MKRRLEATPAGGQPGIPLAIEGVGPPVILLHGCPTPARSLDALRHHLARTHRVVVPELAGVGVGFTAALDLLVAALRDHDITRAAVVGHSGGAYRALQLALDGRIQVTRLVGLGPTACVTPAQLEQFAAVADAVESGALHLPDLTWNAWFTEAFRARRPEARAELDAWFEALGPAAVVGLRHECHGPDLRPHLPDLRLPVYLRVGDLDTSTPPADAAALAAAIPGARLEVVPGCGHFLHLEDAEATLEAVAHFLSP